ncbi:MAG: outer membrane beta-barrel protein [Bacteroidota bacterium]
MKNYSRIAVLLLVLSLLFTSSAYSTEIGFVFGLSTPNDQVNNVYNGNPFKSINSMQHWYKQGANSGFHIGLRARFNMSDNFSFVGGVAWHRFPETEIQVKDNQDRLLTTLKTTQNIIPISAGVQFYLIKSVVGVYGIGELTYNYISNTVDVSYAGQDIPLNLDLNPTNSRIGFGIGAGADLDIKLVKLNLEGRYNLANFIGASAEEKSKAYFSLSLGVYF